MNQYCQNCGTRLSGEAYCPKCQKPVPNANVAPTPSPMPTPPVANGGMGKAIKTCFGKYSDFSGRATRSEYWWFTLFCALVGLGLKIFYGLSPEWAVIGIVWQLSILLPSYAAMVRRIHDTGRSGWLSLWTLPSVILGQLPGFCAGFSATSGESISLPDGFVTFLGFLSLGGIYLLIVLCKPTLPGTNRFGPEPEPF